VFAFGELRERICATVAAEQPRDDRRVDDALAVGDAPQRVDEDRRVVDALLERQPTLAGAPRRGAARSSRRPPKVQPCAQASYARPHRSRSTSESRPRTRYSPKAGRWSGRHPREPARTRRRAPRARLRPDASARVPVRSAPAPDDREKPQWERPTRLLHQRYASVSAVQIDAPRLRPRRPTDLESVRDALHRPARGAVRAG